MDDVAEGKMRAHMLVWAVFYWAEAQSVESIPGMCAGAVGLVDCREPSPQVMVPGYSSRRRRRAGSPSRNSSGFPNRQNRSGKPVKPTGLPTRAVF
jgi:hypothetical protein